VVATGINAGQQAALAGKSDDQRPARLVDRINAPQRQEPDKTPSRASNDSGSESWQGSGNVTIEPRAPKYLVNSTRGGGKQTPAPQHFEPAPPAKPIRPPRRPLTGKDFPELAEHEAEMQGRYGVSSHQFKRKGGLLDWVTGRGKPNAPATNDRSPPSLESPRPSAEELGPHGSREDGDGGQARDQKATGRGRSGEEPLDMPKFLKRPLN
jgi:hypothetical protein